MTLDQALFNWLQIYYLLKQRPEDQAAQETAQFFWNILTEDHGVQGVIVIQQDDMYLVKFEQNGEERQKKFLVEAVEQLWFDLKESGSIDQQ